MKLIVNLLSKETIPNVQFIREFYRPENGDQLLFISSKEMEENEVEKHIATTCNLVAAAAKSIIVNAHSLKSVKDELSKLEMDQYEEALVNVTGGTKIMSLATYDFFKNRGESKIYYIPGSVPGYTLIFPEKKDSKFLFKDKITLKDSLSAYGFEVEEPRTTRIDKTYTERFFRWFLEDKTKEDTNTLKVLQKQRGKKSLAISEIKELSDLLHRIEFPLQNSDKILNREIKYLTGEWFELYMYEKIKNTLSLSDTYIASGITISKGGTKNELDVAFVKEDKLHVIECKTYLVSTEKDSLPKDTKRERGRTTEDKDSEKDSLPTDTLYKSTALNNQMGLLAKASVCTLNREDELNEAHIDRAKNMKIKLITLEKIRDDSFIDLI